MELGNIVGTEEELIEKVYPHLTHHYKDKKWICKSAILSPMNDIVEAINLSLIMKLPGKETIYRSIDTVVEPDTAVQYPTELLNSLQPPGFHHTN